METTVPIIPPGLYFGSLAIIKLENYPQLSYTTSGLDYEVVVKIF